MKKLHRRVFLSAVGTVACAGLAFYAALTGTAQTQGNDFVENKNEPLPIFGAKPAMSRAEFQKVTDEVAGNIIKGMEKTKGSPLSPDETKLAQANIQGNVKTLMVKYHSIK